MRRRQAGRSKLEFAIALALIAVFAAVLLDRLLRLEEAAEKLMVELTIRNMRSGMQYRQAELLAGGREAEMRALLGANPVHWLERPPAGYRGESPRVVAEQVAEGAWVFASDQRLLHYRPRLRDHLQVAGGGVLLSWRVGGDPRRVGAVKIEPTTAYSWAP